MFIYRKVSNSEANIVGVVHYKRKKSFFFCEDFAHYSENWSVASESHNEEHPNCNSID